MAIPSAALAQPVFVNSYQLAYLGYVYSVLRGLATAATFILLRRLGSRSLATAATLLGLLAALRLRSSCRVLDNSGRERWMRFNRYAEARFNFSSLK